MWLIFSNHIANCTNFLVMSRNEITMKSMMAAYALFSAIFAFSAICPIKFLQSAFVGAMEKNNIAPEYIQGMLNITSVPMLVVIVAAGLVGGLIGLHCDFIPTHNQEIADDTANYQTDRNEPESTNQKKQDSLNYGANGKHAFLRNLSQQEHHNDAIRDRNNGRVKYICHRASHAHIGADNHANNPHKSR